MSDPCPHDWSRDAREAHPSKVCLRCGCFEADVEIEAVRRERDDAKESLDFIDAEYARAEVEGLTQDALLLKVASLTGLYRTAVSELESFKRMGLIPKPKPDVDVLDLMRGLWEGSKHTPESAASHIQALIDERVQAAKNEARAAEPHDGRACDGHRLACACRERAMVDAIRALQQELGALRGERVASSAGTEAPGCGRLFEFNATWVTDKVLSDD